MCSLTEYLSKLEQFAPLTLSDKMIEKGCYDNSGVIVKTHDSVNKVLFALDLTEKVVKKAKALSCDTIVTHHPAIYSPINRLDIENVQTKAITMAIKHGFNVLSFHLNLDVACGGIDDCLAIALGAKQTKIIDKIDEKNGYGREFCVETTTLGDIVKRAKKEFRTKRVLFYGSKSKTINTIASFCGAGGTEAVDGVLSGKVNADLIVTADLKHNLLVSLIESGKAVIVLTHYASENLGFKCFYEKVKNIAEQTAYYIEDERFL